MGSPRRVLSVTTALLTWSLLCPARAGAYTIESVASFGCHEKVSTDALRAVRGELATASPLPASEDERALIEDLQFNPDEDMRDLGAATLLASVRDNDLKGRGSGDLNSLAEIHGNPDGQREHCLRGANQKEPAGSEAALVDCRAFIRARVVEALDGLDGAGRPDPKKRTALSVHLSLRGGVDAPLPTYYVRIGQAMHALEDSFTHTYRTPDGMQVTVVLNWLDVVNGASDEAHDGPPHLTAMDQCDDPDPLRKTRRLLATAAAAELLRATLDPSLTRDAKLARVDALLVDYLTYSPGCTFANRWCDAAESQYSVAAGCACSAAVPTSGVGGSTAGVFLAVAIFLRRLKRRGVKLAARLGVSAGLVIAASALLGSTSAEAQTTPTATPTTPSTATPTTPPTTTTITVVSGETPEHPAAITTTVTTPEVTTTTVTAPTQENAHAPPPPVVAPVKEPGPNNPDAMAFGGYLGASGAVDKGALALALGARLRLSRHWTVGLDVETNPWLSLNGTAIRAGTVNFFGTGILRFPLAYERFNLRTTLNLGGSALLTNLYGAPSGSVGLFVGASPLALEWKASRVFYLILNPINVAIPIPHLTVVPFLYPQYRFTFGIEVYSG